MTKIYDLKSNLLQRNVVSAKPQLHDDSKFAQSMRCINEQKELRKGEPRAKPGVYKPRKQSNVVIEDLGFFSPKTGGFVPKK